VSTFESIVDGERSYFMEMNTRIQVEHRVTEQVYRLKFRDPADPQDIFYVDSLIEAMALLSLHGDRLDKPERVMRHRSGAEVRINATNAALQPHAGGVIVGWSPATGNEIRDDQGIGIANPDTGAFIHYRLAGAYDSNIALVITDGQSRKDTLERLAEILRRTELRGYDLETNLLVHYGLLNWMLGRQPLVKPSTQFMSSYLAAVGSLAKVARDVDLEHAWSAMVARCPDGEARDALALKKTLLLRPLERLLRNAHLLGGFIGRNDGRLFERTDKGYAFIGNPINTLSELYLYLNLESRPGRGASEMIWDHDQRILSDASEFYAVLGIALGSQDYAAIARALDGTQPAKGLDAERWEACRAAHAGFQLGNELLLLIPAIAHAAQFDQVKVDGKLEALFPPLFTDTKTRVELQKALAPAPLAASDEIVTPMGGHFFSREAPHLPPLAIEGMHFSAGQPLFVIEVMKMFNKISVPFSGTITKIVLADSDGVAVTKGQAVFKIEPDERRVVETVQAVAERAKALTTKLFASV
jgi:biotin carboxyl carrier protein